MSCSMKYVDLTGDFGDGFDWSVELTIVDYKDSNWELKLGSYGHYSSAHASTKDIRNLIGVLEQMMKDNDEREAVASGDYETEPKEDERNTEAWLDKEG
jgi:hypothetical protein